MDNKYNIEVGRRLYEARKALRMSRAELGTKVHLHESTVKRYEDGQIKALDIDKLKEFACALDVSPEFLMGWEEQQILHPTNKKIPLLGTIACGNPITAIETPSEFVDVPDFVSADFALVCKGDSMINARINDGDIVYIRRQPRVENGEIAAVLVGDEATLKRVFYLESAIMLQAENPAFPPMMVTDDVMILGKATHFVGKVR